MALYMMAMAMLDEPTAHYLSIHSVSLYWMDCPLRQKTTVTLIVGKVYLHFAAAQHFGVCTIIMSAKGGMMSALPFPPGQSDGIQYR